MPVLFITQKELELSKEITMYFVERRKNKRDYETLAKYKSKNLACVNCTHHSIRQNFCFSLNRIVFDNNICINHSPLKDKSTRK